MVTSTALLLLLLVRVGAVLSEVGGLLAMGRGGEAAAVVADAASEPGSSPVTVASPAAIEPAAIEPAAIEPAAGPAEASRVGAARTLPAAAPGLVEVEAMEALGAELKQRQELLAGRERAIELREVAAAVVEERVRAQLTQLQALKADVEKLLSEAAAGDEARVEQLARVYETMKAKRAAAVLEQMDLDLLLPIANRMKEAKLAAIVAEMEPDKARALSAELAKKRPLPSLR